MKEMLHHVIRASRGLSDLVSVTTCRSIGLVNFVLEASSDERVAAGTGIRDQRLKAQPVESATMQWFDEGRAMALVRAQKLQS